MEKLFKLKETNRKKTQDDSSSVHFSPRKAPSTESFEPELMNFENYLLLKNKSKIYIPDSSPDKHKDVFSFEDKIIQNAGNMTKFEVFLNLL